MHNDERWPLMRVAVTHGSDSVGNSGRPPIKVIFDALTSGMGVFIPHSNV